MPFFSEINDGIVNPCTKKIIVFGNGGHARTVFGYLFHEKIVCGFVVDDTFVESQSVIGGYSVVPLSKINEIFPPEKYSVLVALGFKDMNQLRKEKSDELKALGYEFVSFVDDSVRTPSDYSIAANSIIIGNVDIHEGTRIREGVFVSSGAVLGHDSILEEYSWIGSGAVLAGCVVVGAHSVLGMNVSVKQNAILGHHTLVSPNAFVNIDTEAFASIVTNPSKIVRIDSRRLHKLAYK